MHVKESTVERGSYVSFRMIMQILSSLATIYTFAAKHQSLYYSQHPQLYPTAQDYIIIQEQIKHALQHERNLYKIL